MARVKVFPELSILDICHSKAARSSVHKNWKEGVRLTQGHLEMIEDLLPQSCTVGNFWVQRFYRKRKAVGRNNTGGADIFIELKCNVTQVVTCLSSMNRQKRHSNILISKVGLLFREGLKQGKNHMEG